MIIDNKKAKEMLINILEKLNKNKKLEEIEKKLLIILVQETIGGL